MSRPERQQNVLDLLKGLRGIEPLKQLFWSELNYQRVNQPLSRRGWTESASKALVDDPVLFAGGGDDNAFHVIYCRLASDALSRGFERPVVTQLLREHPYALFVFSNQGQTDWHFLNVKYDDQAERRRLFRRITVRPGAGLRTATERVQLLDLAEINPELFGITPLAIQQRCDAAFDVETVTKDFFREIANWYFWALKNASFPKDAPKEADGHDHISIIRLITRLIFCWFVKEKGLIAKMRFFISLIVDQKIDDTQDNRGVLPLPNLETKFVSANTLIGIERPDAQGKLFSNAKVDKLKSELSRIRHRMFTAKTPSTKQTLREKDKAVRQALAGEIQKSLVKANEDEICQTRLEMEKARKALEEEQSKPVEWKTTRITNLFGETEETRIDTGKDKKRRLKERVKQLESNLLRANQRDADIDATARRLANWDPYDQNASADFFDPEWMFGLLDGFDLTFGNPPYLIVKEANTDETLLAQYAGYQTADFKINLFALFLERAIVLGSKCSIHSYIIPDPALNLPAFRKLRKHILDNTALSAISYYHEDIFHSASVGKSVILLYIKGCSAESFVFREFLTLYTKKEAIIPFQQVREDSDLKLSYSFSEDGEVKLLQKLKKNPIKLARYCDIYDGINPGSVEIKNTLITNRYIDKLSKKIIDGKDFTKFAPIHWDGSYIYYSETFVGQLKKKIQKSGRDFTARIIKKTNFFEREKIVSRQTAESIIATLDSQKYFVKNSVHSSLLRSDFAGKISLLSIVALMNSRVIDWFYRKESMEGGRLFPQVKIGRLENLPFPAVELLIKENNYLTDVVEKIMVEKKRNPNADITILEQKIDRKAYDLYGLTPEEIKIVESASAEATARQGEASK